MALACGALLALGSGTAWGVGETVVTYKGSPGNGSQIAVGAAGGKVNMIAIEFTSAGVVVIQDTDAGATEASPHCQRPTPAEVRCKDQGLRGIDVSTADRSDSVALRFSRDFLSPGLMSLSLGSGDDRLTGAGGRVPSGQGPGNYLRAILGPGADVAMLGTGLGSVGAGIGIGAVVAAGRGNDRVTLTGRGRIQGQAGSDRLLGRRGQQRLFGNRGNDVLSCGRGKDIASGGLGRDRLLKGADCEIHYDQGD